MPDIEDVPTELLCMIVGFAYDEGEEFQREAFRSAAFVNKRWNAVVRDKIELSLTIEGFCGMGAVFSILGGKQHRQDVPEDPNTQFAPRKTIEELKLAQYTVSDIQLELDYLCSDAIVYSTGLLLYAAMSTIKTDKKTPVILTYCPALGRCQISTVEVYIVIRILRAFLMKAGAPYSLDLRIRERVYVFDSTGMFPNEKRIGRQSRAVDVERLQSCVGQLLGAQDKRTQRCFGKDWARLSEARVMIAEHALKGESSDWCLVVLAQSFVDGIPSQVQDRHPESKAKSYMDGNSLRIFLHGKDEAVIILGPGTFRNNLQTLRRYATKSATLPIPSA